MARLEEIFGRIRKRSGSKEKLEQAEKCISRILSLREIHSCLMEKPTAEIINLQTQCLYEMYMENSVRKSGTWDIGYDSNGFKVVKHLRYKDGVFDYNASR